MKIAYDAKRFFHNTSGLGNYSRDLIRIMAAYFPKNQYFLLNKNKSERGKEILELQSVEYLPVSSGKFSRQFKMGKDAQNAGSDIFHGLSGELPMRWNDKQIKKIVTIHDLIFERYPQYYSFFDRKIHFWKFKKAANQADIVVAISEQTKRDIVEILKISEDKIKVIYQGCHPAFKTKPTADFLQKVKEKYNLPGRFLLNVGTIEERKNLLNVAKALENTAIPLVVVGRETKYFKKVKQLAKKNKVQIFALKNVSMEELAAIYRLADIFIYPSFFEGFGIPVIEALYSETVAITSNCSSLPEAGGPFSVYIDPKNSEDIRAKILFLWDNETERKRRAEKGLEFVQKFRDQVIAEQYQALYTNLLA